MSFSWTAVTNASAYDLEFDNGTAYASTVTGINTNSYSTSALLASVGSHTWRIRAKNGTTVGAWSSSRTYTIPLSLGTPTLSSPVNGTIINVGSTLNLSWTTVTNATSYDVEFDNGTTYAYTYNTLTNSYSAIVETINVGSHTWRVRAKNGNGVGEWSTAWNYTAKQLTTITQIQWSGETWNVRSGTGNPESNNWLASTSNVWVDSNGNLHLKIFKNGDKWYCSEIYSVKSFGFGEYTFQLSSRIDQLDKNVVLGLFTYKGNGSSVTPQENEIDIEFSNWNNSILPNNTQYVFQYRQSGNVNNPNSITPYRFKTALNGDFSTHKFIWNIGRILFQSYYGHYANLPSIDYLINQPFQYTDTKVPPESDEKVHLNLYLYGATLPSNVQEAEVTIKSFTFKKVGDLVVQVYNIDNTSTPIPGANGIVKLFNSDNVLIGEQKTTQNGFATFTNIPEGSGYYYQVYHNTTKPSTIYGQEYWGTQTGVTVNANQSTPNSFTRNQPYCGKISIFNGTKDVTGQSIEPNTQLKVKLQIINLANIIAFPPCFS